MGTALADWFGLRTFALAKFTVADDDEIPLGRGRSAEPGTAIAIKAEPGTSWGGSAAGLRAITNAADIPRIVVLDTWLLNCDRHPPDLDTRKPNYDNVFLSAESAPAGKFLLTAMDHTHCFCCGRELGPRLSDIGNVKDRRVYGRFPEFEEFLSREAVEEAVANLSRLERGMVKDVVSEIADDWRVTEPGREALTDLIFDRADYISGTIVQSMFPQ